ncbi:MAG: hypothetical protein ACI93L_003753, partial [Cyclobacteriaceae bacterium]
VIGRFLCLGFCGGQYKNCRRAELNFLNPVQVNLFIQKI